MPRKPTLRPCGVRMDHELFDDLAAVASARGVSVSAVINWLLFESRPKLQAILAAHEKAMQEARQAG